MSADLVYSTAHGKMCPACERPATQCRCSREKSLPRGDGVVRVSRQTKGRKGKAVTVITGLALGEDGLRDLARELKRKSGSGGTVHEGTIEIQGDRRDMIVEELAKRGIRARRAGG